MVSSILGCVGCVGYAHKNKEKTSPKEHKADETPRLADERRIAGAQNPIKPPIPAASEPMGNGGQGDGFPAANAAAVPSQRSPW